MLSRQHLLLHIPSSFHLQTGTWAYFCTILSTFIYTCVPWVSLVWGVHPVTLSGQFALAATLYFTAGVAQLGCAGSLVSRCMMVAGVVLGRCHSCDPSKLHVAWCLSLLCCRRSRELLSSQGVAPSGEQLKFVCRLGCLAPHRPEVCVCVAQVTVIVCCGLLSSQQPFYCGLFISLTQGMFLSLVSNYLLAFTYLKAIINTWL